MFKNIGAKFLDPNFRDEEEGGAGASGGQSSSSQAKGSGTVTLDPQKATDTKKKKGCC